MSGKTSAPAGRTVTVRPIDFSHIEAVALGRRDRSFGAYLLTPAGTMTRVTVTAQPRHKAARQQDVPFTAVPRAVANTGKNAETQPFKAAKDDEVGFEVPVEVVDMFGTHHDGTLFTSAEAEQSAWLLHGRTNPEQTRALLHVVDPDGEALPLTPVYGSQVTVSAIVADIEPGPLSSRIEEMLVAEFGEALRARVKVLTRPVEDRRVAVFDSVTNKPIAVGILPAEVSSVMASAGRGAVRVEAMPEGLIVGD